MVNSSEQLAYSSHVPEGSVGILLKSPESTYWFHRVKSGQSMGVVFDDHNKYPVSPFVAIIVCEKRRKAYGQTGSDVVSTHPTW
eukprot:CAMPEP_0184689648 /NCGR_PEP_ID=MMETSP0312-20130426/30774_1 /TAXON_ID=31354 /ORGANISM="Compsopogon coeruleus, Strain SAG 36.94" /LENGTH=83 /DNA_ID=CAMNT_0027147025 /DNA_START=392 /DNA_END=643 /DNA_ORIENTATION=-